MKRKNVGLLFLIILGIFTGCKRNPLYVNVSGINVEVHIKRLEKDLFSSPADSVIGNIPGLQEKYGLFFKRFTQVINIGTPGTPVFNEYLKIFLKDDLNKEVYRKVMAVYPDLHDLEEKMTGAFKHYKYYFPDKPVPEIYSFTSGFNASLIIDNGILGFGLDRYLGKDVIYYDQLNIPKYIQQKMTKEKIPSDGMAAWAATEFSFQPQHGDTTVTDNVINRMIYKGKLLYFVKAMMPKENEDVIMGYTQKQLKWCRMNEGQMWAYLVEHKLLFKTDYLTINKLTRDAPFTSFFPRESPGRAANWIGWQIVKNYMSRHKEVSLKQLMTSFRYQEILDQSQYDPG